MKLRKKLKLAKRKVSSRYLTFYFKQVKLLFMGYFITIFTIDSNFKNVRYKLF